MARFLAATVPLTGHVHPMSLVVKALVERGHTVAWYGASKFASLIEKAGATYVPMRTAHDWDDSFTEDALPVLRGKRGLARVKAQLRAMFIEPMVDQLRDLEVAADLMAPDVVIGCQAHLGAALLHEKTGIPWAQIGISGLVFPSIDTAPFGSALPPARDERDHRRNRMLNWIVLRALFGSVNRAYRRGRVAAGLPSGTQMYFDVLSPQLYLHPTIPAFEYPRSDLPPQVHFVGPWLPRTTSDPAALPPWWGDVEAAYTRGTPIVLVTQGTLAIDPHDLLRPALLALANEDVLVVAITARAFDGPAALGLDGIPANARLAPFVPYHSIMALASVVVTNGGYGGVQMALHHGVPLVVAAGSEEKPEIAARVAWSGTGIDLKTGKPSPTAVRAAVSRALTEPGFRERAQAMASVMAGYNGPARAADLIERLAAEQMPVLRSDADHVAVSRSVGPWLADEDSGDRRESGHRARAGQAASRSR